MALKGALSVFHIPVPEAYIRVGRISGSPRDGWLVEVSLYADAATAAGKDPSGMPNRPFEVFALAVPYVTTEPNPFVLAYAAIKDLPRFAETVFA